MELLGDEAQVKLVSVHLEIVLFFTQDRCMVVPKVPQARIYFWTHPMELLGDVGHAESHFFLLRDSVSVGVR